MAIAKVQFKESASATPEVWMDTTQKTVTAGSMLSGITALKNDGTGITGNIASKSSPDLTASGATVTAPAGYYPNAASKSVATTTHPNPTASINATTGVVTASHTQTAGYVAAGTTTGTLPLATQAAKTVAPTESEQTAVSAGVYTTGAVKVGAISSTYVGSDVAQNDSSDLTASGATVTAPAGFYAESASKTVASGSASTPATSITANPTISVNASGLITASVSGSKTVTPTVSAGYVSAGTAGTVSVSGSNTQQLSTQAAATITPSTTSQTAVAAGKYTTGAVTVAAMPSGTAGTPTATKGTVNNHSVSITPSVTNTTGYITGGTKNGTAVTVNVAELESGTKTITENGTGISVSGYSSVDVNVSGGGGTLGDVTVPSAVNKQTVYPDGCQNVVYPIGSADSMAALGWAITIPSDDMANMAFYVPYEVRGTLRTSTTGGDKTSDISITGTTYRAHSGSVVQSRFGFPFSYSGDNMVNSIYAADTSDGFVVDYLTSGTYTVGALSDLTIKEKGFREEAVVHQFTGASTSLTFSWDSSSFSNGDICAVSGVILASDRSGGIVYCESFDVQFLWDGETHAFNVMSGETIAGNCNITPTTVTYTNVLTARNTYGGVNVSKYEEYDGLSSVTIQPGTV